MTGRVEQVPRTGAVTDAIGTRRLLTTEPSSMRGVRRTGVLRPKRFQADGPPADIPVRTMVVWVPDWPLVAAGVGRDEPAAVFVANRVVACTEAARAAGVARHMRRREAQGRCPSLQVLVHDPDRDARRFEAVAIALERLTPRIEITRPGRCAFPTIGPSRYFGGDEALAHEAVAGVTAALRETTGAEIAVAVGVADGPFAAGHAARSARRDTGVCVVPPTESAAFVAPLPLRALDRPDLVDVLGRLGLRTLGDLAALPARDVLGRFGSDTLEAHRLASGLDIRPPATEPPPPDLLVAADFDPPAEQVAPAAFVARGLADELRSRLEARGSACTRIVIGAESEHGERSERVWRHESSFSAGAIADRVRWQLDGWLCGPVLHRPSAGISRLWLQPDEVVPAGGRQLGMWGGDTATAERAVRAIARVQAMVGVDAVLVPEYCGGRHPAEQLRLVPAAAVDLTVDRPSARPAWVDAPWPGKIPSPSPATLHDPVGGSTADLVDLVDDDGRTVAVDGRCQVTAAPSVLRLGNRSIDIVGWAGPWPVDERWWDTDRHRRQARFQIATADGAAHLLALSGGRWSLSATYD